MRAQSLVASLVSLGVTSAFWNPLDPVEIFSDDLLPLLEEEKQVVSAEALQKLIDVENLRSGAEAFYSFANTSIPDYDHPTRVIGSKGHLATIEYIKDTLNSLNGYYTVKTQAFTALVGDIRDYYVTEDDGKSVPVKPLSLTPGSDGVVTGEIVLVNGQGCLGSEYAGVAGKIALVPRGQCSFGEKSEFAGLNGAKALLVWDPEQVDDEIVRGTLSIPLSHQVATLAVDCSWAEAAPGTTVELFVDADVSQIDTLNVIAETVEGDHENVVMIGGHSDSVAAGPGINDDGSGSIAVLEVAKQLANFKVNNAVRFAWWAAEEEGLVGSLYYTNNIPPSDAKKIRLFIDIDMIASPNYIYSVYDSNDEENPKGSGALRDLFTEYYDNNGVNHTYNIFDGRSDYVGFIEIGIPAGGVDTGAEVLKTPEEVEQFGGVAGEQYDQCYHELCDDLSNPNYDAWLLNTKLIASAIGGYAESLEGFPDRIDTYSRDGRKMLRDRKPM